MGFSCLLGSRRPRDFLRSLGYLGCALSYRGDREAEEGPRLLAEFDPTTKRFPQPRAATYAPFRHPQWKTYSNVGHAKNAIKHHRFIIRYEWRDDSWVEVERKETERRYD